MKNFSGASISFTSLFSVVLLIIGALGLIYGLLLLVGADPEVTAHAIYMATFGSLRNFGETLLRATPLLLIAVTLAPSLRAGVYNIGAPGQMGMGAIAATIVALNIPTHNQFIVVTACAMAATGLIAGILKAHWKINEIVPTLALNFIVAAILQYLLNGPMQGHFANLPQSSPLPVSAGLPVILPGTRVHIGLIIAIAAGVALFVVDRSLIGYRLRLLGANATLAKRAGVRPGVYTMWLFAVAGIGAGLAGWMQVAGIDHRLYPSLSDPVGYAGLFVALLGGLNPWGIIVAAFLFGALLNGGEALQVGAGVAPEIIQVLLGLILYIYAAKARNRASGAVDQGV
jgi:simple sugar transport system permease protein